MEHRGNPLPQFLVDQIRRLRREGMSIRTIAALSGVASATVQKYCDALPIPGRPQRPRLAAPVPALSNGDSESEGPTDAELARVEHDLSISEYDPLLDEYLADG